MDAIHRDVVLRGGPKFLQPNKHGQTMKQKEIYEYEKWYNEFQKETFERQKANLWTMEFDPRLDWKTFEKIKNYEYERTKDMSWEEIAKGFADQQMKAEESLRQFKTEVETRDPLPNDKKTFEEIKSETEYRGYLAERDQKEEEKRKTHSMMTRSKRQLV